MQKIKQNAKAIAALVGSVVAALLASVSPDATVGRVLTIIAVVATAVGTWAVENAD